MKQGTTQGPLANPECQSISERYDIAEALGQGTTAVVYKGRRRQNGEQVALKVMRIDDEELLHIAQREYNLLSNVQHPHIIRVQEMFTYPRGVVLVFDFIPGQSLGDAVHSAPGQRFHEKDYRRVFKALMEAVAHLHSHDIIHRDVKAANILVDSALQDIKLLDFNTACNVLESGALTMTGTQDYLPPEVLMGESHTSSSDVWAVGLCLYLMVSGVRPIERKVFASQQEFVHAIKQRLQDPFTSTVWETVPAECKDMVQRCLATSRAERPSAAEILESAWLAE